VNDRLLATAARHLAPVIVVMSLLVLYRGHNLPGGGFIGGLVAAIAGVLVYLAEGPEALLRRLRWAPENWFMFGLVLALLSGLLAMAQGLPLLTALWLPAVEAPVIGKILLGTPLLFDVGVFFVVVGFSLSVLLHLDRMEQWKS